MKKFMTFILAGVLMSVLCVGFVACNDPNESELKPGLGEVIPGMETMQATGTIVGWYSNGFGSLFVQVDDEYPIGSPIESYNRYPCGMIPEGIYQNAIQVQPGLGNLTSQELVNTKISFSYRLFDEERDDELFTLRNKQNEYCMPPDIPIYTITDFQIIND